MSRQRPSTPNDPGAFPSRRPATPTEALSGQSSSAWVPDPEPGPSPDVHPTSRRPATPEEAIGRPIAQTQPDQPAPLSKPAPTLNKPLIFGIMGGVALLLIGFLIFVLNQPDKPVEQTNNTTPQTPPANTTPTTPQPENPKPKLELPKPITPPTVTSSNKTIDLLKLINLQRDTLEGTWKLEGNQLKSDASTRARINIPYDPPREYDFLIEFTRNSGVDCIAQNFSDVHQCTWMVGGWKGTINGFHLVSEKTAQYNPGSDKSFVLKNGERHTSIVRVRKNWVEGVVDGKVLVHHETDGKNLSSKEWAVTAPLGLGTYQSPTTFHKVELVEIGK